MTRLPPFLLGAMPEIARLMTTGGDARIRLDPITGLNRYYAGPYPREVTAYASSTANDLSSDAMARLECDFSCGGTTLSDGEVYAIFLNTIRARLRAAYDLGQDVDIFIAASGTDLEYVGMLAVPERSNHGISNLLLGSDEVGSGCVWSAAGCYFADETALGIPSTQGEKIAGFQPVSLANLPLRDETGTAFSSALIAAKIVEHIESALAAQQHPLIHIVHGSKTGLVLPHLAEIDALIEQFRDKVTFVVDACQARITGGSIAAYLERGIVVFLTGSKFIGGPPFGGFALLPNGIATSAPALASGISDIFRQAEIPDGWAGRETLQSDGNPGLALRLAASLFELERFQTLELDDIARVVSAFNDATDLLIDRLAISKVANVAPGDSAGAAVHPVEKQTLITLDLSHDSSGDQKRMLDFDDAVRIHKGLIDAAIRLGQPVRSVKLADGRWGATLRIGLSMPQIYAFHALSDESLAVTLRAAITQIEAALIKLL